jgi:hypothetical protein
MLPLSAVASDFCPTTRARRRLLERAGSSRGAIRTAHRQDAEKVTEKVTEKEEEQQRRHAPSSL